MNTSCSAVALTAMLALGACDRRDAAAPRDAGSSTSGAGATQAAPAQPDTDTDSDANADARGASSSAAADDARTSRIATAASYATARKAALKSIDASDLRERVSDIAAEIERDIGDPQ